MAGSKTKFHRSEGKKGVGIYTLIAILILVLGLLFTVSMSNKSTYRFVSNGETITLWEGKFIPKGSEPVKNFDPLQAGELKARGLTGKNYVGQRAAYKALFDELMALVTAESAKGKEADLNKLRMLLDRGENLLDRGERAGLELLGARFQLAKALVNVAEMSLERAYRKALPAYEEAIESGTGDRETLEVKRDTMQSVLESAPSEYR
ncbi:MAG: hypothetical protein LJE89_06240 [Deltaproteobacteria bacterium]|nr:hypothetical protein [Deltaproteobacteria bacterium]